MISTSGPRLRRPLRRRAAQALLHPQGCGRRGIHTTQHPAEVAWTGGRGLYIDLEGSIDRGRHRCDSNRADRCTGQGADLACDTLDAEAVAAVRCQVDLDQRIIQPQQVDHALTGHGIGRQVHQAGMVIAQAQLARRAQHAEGFHAAQLALPDLQITRQFCTHRRQRVLAAGLDVRCTADDLQRFALPGIDAADTQLVGIGMGIDGHDLRDQQVAQAHTGRLNRIDLQPGHSQLLDQLIGRDRRVHPFTQPLFAEFHNLIHIKTFTTENTEHTEKTHYYCFCHPREGGDPAMKREQLFVTGFPLPRE